MIDNALFISPKIRLKTNILKKNLRESKNVVPLQSRATKAGTNNAEIAQLVEHDLAKVGVASSSLVFRSESRQAAERLPVLVSYYGDDGPTERPRCPRGAAFRQEGGGNVKGARQSEAQPRARVSFSAHNENDSLHGCRFALLFDGPFFGSR